MYFRCKICKLPISKEVERFENETSFVFEPEKDLLPSGLFYLKEKRGAPDAFEINGLNCDFISCFLNLNDVINTKHHSDSSRLIGCCGLSGYFGINTVCANNHEVGIEYSDCIFPRTMSLVFEKVQLINNE